MTLRVGQKVVCVVERAKLLPSALMASAVLGYLPALPAIGVVYEIAQLRAAHDQLWLRIVELDDLVWWWAIAFRPAVQGEGELAALRALLDGVPKPARQRLLVDMLEAEDRGQKTEDGSSVLRAPFAVFRR